MKNKKSTTKAKARVTSVSVSRLFNLGNYENVKYDICAEVPPGVSAWLILAELNNISLRLKPIKVPQCAMEYQTALQKPAKDRTDWEHKNFTQWRESMKAYDSKVERRNKAVAALDSLGGSSTYKDAKLDWNDFEDLD